MSKSVMWVVGGVLFVAAFAPYTDENKWLAYVVFAGCVAIAFVLALRHVLGLKDEGL